MKNGNDDYDNNIEQPFPLFSTTNSSENTHVLNSHLGNDTDNAV